ncbi:MAG: hypothetical protein ACXAC7_23170 [Candidatus Hodarchaeales archaeon]|jgi:hypothetical protein
MNLKYLFQSKKRQFSFNDINEILQLSEGYTRQLVAEMVKKKILKPNKEKKDKRYVIYSLEWLSIRNYLMSDPPDFDEIILSLVDKRYHGQNVAIDNFDIIHSADTLMELTEKINIEDENSTIFITSAGVPKNQIILELS